MAITHLRTTVVPQDGVVAVEGTAVCFTVVSDDGGTGSWRVPGVNRPRARRRRPT